MPRSWASFSPNGLPIIALRAGDVIIRALVDTGAAQSLIGHRLVRQLDLPETGKVSIVGVGMKPLQVPVVSIETSAIGRCPLRAFSAGVMDLNNLRIGVQVILGVNSYQPYRLQFDFARGRLYLLS